MGRVMTSLTLIGLTCGIGICCSRQEMRAVPSPAVGPPRQALPSAAPTMPVDQPQSIESTFVKSNSLSYNGYEGERLHKRAHVDRAPLPVDAAYVVVRKGHPVLATFDGVYHALGNGADLGLISLLGDNTKQLVVSLDMPRGGVQWVVDLGANARVLFDGSE